MSFERTAGLARISHRLTVEARDRPAITSLRLLAVLNVLSDSTAEPYATSLAPHSHDPRMVSCPISDFIVSAISGLSNWGWENV